MDAYGLQTGSVDLRTAGPIAFGPAGVLFLADNDGARIFAVDVADRGPAASDPAPFDLADVDLRVASFLGCDAGDITIRDMAVSPASRDVYLSVQRGRGDAGSAVILRIDRTDGSIAEVPLDAVPMAAFDIADAPTTQDARLDTTLPMGNEGEEITVGARTIRILRRPIRTSTVTDMAWVDGEVIVAGLSNEEFSSKLRRIPFPFYDEAVGGNLEIFHVSHGRWETAAPIRAFVPYDSGRSILASYTCTPIVQFALADLTPGSKTVGRTVAELGSSNQPLDMIAFQQGGREHLLVANSTHGLIKIDCRDIDGQAALTEPTEPIGVPRQMEALAGVVRLANLDESHVLALQAVKGGRQHLRSLATASL